MGTGGYQTKKSRCAYSRTLHLWLALLVGWMPITGSANNHHDHLYSVPSARDFLTELELLLDIRGVVYRSFPDTAAGGFSVRNARRYLDAVTDGQAKEKDIERCLDRIGPDTTTREVLELLFPGTRIEARHLALLLTFPDSARARGLRPNERRSVYIGIEGVRRSLFLTLVSNGVRDGQPAASRIFANYFLRERLMNRGILHVSVPNDWFPRRWSERERRFLEPNGLTFLTELHAQAAQAGTDLVTFMSINRKMVEGDTDLVRLVRQLEDVHANARADGKPILGGIDIAGSIVEKDMPDGSGAEVARVIERFHMIFDLCARLKIPLRIHAFEAANRGLFYEALWYAIEEYRGDPLEIRIGHTNKLTRGWLGDPRAEEGSKERKGGLRANERIRVILESNPLSNHHIQGATPADLVATLKLAREAGHTIIPGGDGGGFLPGGANYTDTKAWLEKNRVPFEFDTLHPMGIDCGERLGKLVPPG